MDNGTGAAELERAASRLDGCELLRLESNLGYSRAVNLAARRAQGEALVLLNDDSVVDPGYVERITEALDPGEGVVMAAGVMRDVVRPDLIDTAGIVLDRTLLAYDYLNGEPVDAARWSCARPGRPLGSGGRVLERGVHRGGRVRRGLLDVSRGRRSRPAPAPGGRVLPARAVRARDAPALGDPGRGLGAQGLPGRLRARLPAAQVGRAHPAPAARGAGAGARRSAAGRRSSTATSAACAAGCAGLREARTREPYPLPAALPDPPRFASTLWRRWRRRARLRGRAH